MSSVISSNRSFFPVNFFCGGRSQSGEVAFRRPGHHNDRRRDGESVTSLSVVRLLAVAQRGHAAALPLKIKAIWKTAVDFSIQVSGRNSDYPAEPLRVFLCCSPVCCRASGQGAAVTALLYGTCVVTERFFGSINNSAIMYHWWEA